MVSSAAWAQARPLRTNAADTKVLRTPLPAPQAAFSKLAARLKRVLVVSEPTALPRRKPAFAPVTPRLFKGTTLNLVSSVQTSVDADFSQDGIQGGHPLQSDCQAQEQMLQVSSIELPTPASASSTHPFLKREKTQEQCGKQSKVETTESSLQTPGVWCTPSSATASATPGSPATPSGRLSPGSHFSSEQLTAKLVDLADGDENSAAAGAAAAAAVVTDAQEGAATATAAKTASTTVRKASETARSEQAEVRKAEALAANTASTTVQEVPKTASSELAEVQKAQAPEVAKTAGAAAPRATDNVLLVDRQAEPHVDDLREGSKPIGKDAPGPSRSIVGDPHQDQLREERAVLESCLSSTQKLDEKEAPSQHQAQENSTAEAAEPRRRHRRQPPCRPPSRGSVPVSAAANAGAAAAAARASKLKAVSSARAARSKTAEMQVKVFRRIAEHPPALPDWPCREISVAVLPRPTGYGIKGTQSPEVGTARLPRTARQEKVGLRGTALLARKLRRQVVQVPEATDEAEDEDCETKYRRLLQLQFRPPSARTCRTLIPPDDGVKRGVAPGPVLRSKAAELSLNIQRGPRTPDWDPKVPVLALPPMCTSMPDYILRRGSESPAVTAWSPSKGLNPPPSRASPDAMASPAEEDSFCLLAAGSEDDLPEMAVDGEDLPFFQLSSVVGTEELTEEQELEMQEALEIFNTD